MNANLRAKMLKYFSSEDMLYFEKIIYMFRGDQNWDMLLSMLVGTNLLDKLIVFLKNYYEYEYTVFVKESIKDEELLLGYYYYYGGLWSKVLWSLRSITKMSF